MFSFRKIGSSAAVERALVPELHQQSQQPKIGLADPGGLNETAGTPEFDIPFASMMVLRTDSRLSKASGSIAEINVARSRRIEG